MSLRRDRAQQRASEFRWRSRATRDVVLAGFLLPVFAVAGRQLEGRLAFEDLTLTMSLFAAAAGATAAVLGVVAARLTSDRRVGWLSLALGCYGLVAIPTATVTVFDSSAEPVIGAMRFLVQCLVVVMLVIALINPAPPTALQVGGELLGVATLIGGVGWLGAAFPAVTETVTGWQPLRLGVAVAWTGLALGITAFAVQHKAGWLSRVGTALTVLGIAHTARIAASVSPIGNLGQVLTGVCMLAVVVVLWATACLAQEALARLDAERATKEEELRLARQRLAHTAERDHELRSGLAGLAGATKLLRTVDTVDRREPDKILLGTMVASELSRLDELLQAPDGQGWGRRATAGYALAPLLIGLVELRSSSGMELHLAMESRLRARGSPTVLAQVMTNLLGNAAQHAPGSPVHIEATRQGDRVVVLVSDSGPGVSPGWEQAVFERGRRDGPAGGLGLGLHISRSLLADEGGTIRIHPRAPGQHGCTVEVQLPAAEWPAVGLSLSSLPPTAWKPSNGSPTTASTAER